MTHPAEAGRTHGRGQEKVVLAAARQLIRGGGYMAMKRQPQTLVLLLLTLTLVAALSGAPGVGPPTTSAAQKQTVTVWVGSWWSSQVPLIMERWTSDHPEIMLKIGPLPINGYLDKFIASALAGNPPDVIDLDGTWVSTVAAQGLLQPLDGYAKNLDAKDFVPSIWAASHYHGV